MKWTKVRRKTRFSYTTCLGLAYFSSWLIFTPACLVELQKIWGNLNTSTFLMDKSKPQMFSASQTRWKFVVTKGSELECHGSPSEKLSATAEDNDLFYSFRGLLMLGRILGVIPFSVNKSSKSLCFSWWSSATVTSAFCAALLAVNAVLAVGNAICLQKRNAQDVARSLGLPLFALGGLFRYVYFLMRGNEFLKIFKIWESCGCNIYYYKKDTHLHRTVVITSTIIFVFAVLGNGLLYTQYFEVFDYINGHGIKQGEHSSNVSVVHLYYKRAHGHWNKFISYHPIFTTIAFLVHKLAFCCLNYTEVLMALMCRAICFKFKALCWAAEDTLLLSIPVDSADTPILSKIGHQPWAWAYLAKDHERLCKLLDVMNKFFSPLIFVIYWGNIYMVCMMLLAGINPNSVEKSWVGSIYAPWTFFYLILRTFLLSYWAAKVHEHAHDIRNIIQHCPVELYNRCVAKLDRKVNTGPKLGITGLDCFVVTKPFILGILNVVFTIEIVLLQGLPTE